MKYITLNHLNQTIRENIWKIPHDIDFIIGVPRSGMIVASIISEFLNVPLIDYKSFCYGVKASGGNRLTLLKKERTNRVLVVDDTVYSGASMRGVRESLKNIKLDFIYMCAFLEGNGKDTVDLYLEDVRKYTKKDSSIVLYEWNIFHHYPFLMERCMYDIDGVLCVDPCDERDTEKYEHYIANAIPLFTPSVKVGTIISYRLKKYGDITKKWLKDNGIDYNHLYLCKAESYEERATKYVSPAEMKAKVYSSDKNSVLFIESDPFQARRIYEISKKPVLCVKNNILYGGE